jgi:deazaflavin-dependent oxidoreductase (nitroreductase family)
VEIECEDQMQHSQLTVMLVQAGTALHIAAYRVLRGNVPQRWLGKDCILVTTAGRKSGKKRTSPLLFVRDGDDYVVVASWGGSDQHPHWFLNLRANPRVTVEDHGRTTQAVAHLVEDEQQYQQIWQRFVAIYAGYELYQRRTTRKIPLVRLSVIQSMSADERGIAHLS